MVITDKAVVDAVRRIHFSPDQHQVAQQILLVLADVFGFDYLLFAVRKQRGRDFFFEGRYCAGKAPQGLVLDTQRHCSQQQTEDEDILCYVSRERKIIKVDPLDESSPLWRKLHRETLKKFGYRDPIYFIPLEDRSGLVEAVIHASLPRDRDAEVDE